MASPATAALLRLDRAAAAARRARRDPRDERSLHRFRVDCRRLLALLEALGGPLGAPRGPRRRLRRLLRKTGPWRDAHVEALRLGPGRLSRRAGRRLRRLAKGRRWERRVQRALRALRPALAEPRRPPAELRSRLEARARKARLRLRRRLRVLDMEPGHESIHRARIAARRLRYLLEALGSGPHAPPRPGELRALQAALGRVHDADVMAASLERRARREEDAARELARLRRLRRAAASRSLRLAARLFPGTAARPSRSTLRRAVRRSGRHAAQQAHRLRVVR